MSERVYVEVVYAEADNQWIETVSLPVGATLGDAIEASGFDRLFPGLRDPSTPVGVFGELRSVTSPLADGDRVEIYRPLTVSPTEARRLRAAAKAAMDSKKKP